MNTSKIQVEALNLKFGLRPKGRKPTEGVLMEYLDLRDRT
jgi:hypothetical protein